MIAEDEGRSQADVIRRILDEALGLVGTRDDRLTALRESFGCLDDDRDPETWLDEIRSRSAEDRLRAFGS